MLVWLALVGLLGGVTAGASSCVVREPAVIRPTVPRQGVRAGSPGPAPGSDHASSGRRASLVVLGLVVAFGLWTVVASLVSALGVPLVVLVALGSLALTLLGIGLIVPRVAAILEAPARRVVRDDTGTVGSGFGRGLALGAVSLSCAGPALAAIAIAGSTGLSAVVWAILLATFAVGAATPTLALAGRHGADRRRAVARHERAIRTTGGVLLIALALGLLLGAPAAAQPSASEEPSDAAGESSPGDGTDRPLDLSSLENDQNKDLDLCENDATRLDRCGTAPDITGITQWFNTPGDQPISLADERGMVVLVDFFAYACINCQRSVPHVVAWQEAYADAGLRVVGIHSPEYAFEKDPANVMAGSEALGITYPVAIDDSLSTWTNYRNRYWPAHYLIDAEGIVRNVQFGEGNYAVTEQMIRDLLVAADPDVQLPPPTDVADDTPDGSVITPETFFGWTKVRNYAGSTEYDGGTDAFTYPTSQDDDTFAVQGTADVETQYLEAIDEPVTVRLYYTASEVRMVLGGTGTLEVSIDGVESSIDVSGYPRSYQLTQTDDTTTGVIEVTLPPGVQAYSFTFGGR